MRDGEIPRERKSEREKRERAKLSSNTSSGQRDREREEWTGDEKERAAEMEKEDGCGDGENSFFHRACEREEVERSSARRIRRNGGEKCGKRERAAGERGRGRVG